uniref:(California timema) hypothetical protein n=1 Tax=Timema californicum TaxID=61474 RepID=A0A7R9J9Q0_TIMCA|nr:unnamed protein product [Timema californicum]
METTRSNSELADSPSNRDLSRKRQAREDFPKPACKKRATLTRLAKTVGCTRIKMALSTPARLNKSTIRMDAKKQPELTKGSGSYEGAGKRTRGGSKQRTIQCSRGNQRLLRKRSRGDSNILATSLRSRKSKSVVYLGTFQKQYPCITIDDSSDSGYLPSTASEDNISTVSSHCSSTSNPSEEEEEDEEDSGSDWSSTILPVMATYYTVDPNARREGQSSSTLRSPVESVVSLASRPSGDRGTGGPLEALIAPSTEAIRPEVPVENWPSHSRDSLPGGQCDLLSELPLPSDLSDVKLSRLHGECSRTASCGGLGPCYCSMLEDVSKMAEIYNLDLTDTLSMVDGDYDEYLFLDMPSTAPETED